MYTIFIQFNTFTITKKAAGWWELFKDFERVPIPRKDLLNYFAIQWVDSIIIYF